MLFAKYAALVLFLLSFDRSDNLWAIVTVISCLKLSSIIYFTTEVIIQHILDECRENARSPDLLSGIPKNEAHIDISSAPVPQ